MDSNIDECRELTVATKDEVKEELLFIFFRLLFWFVLHICTASCHLELHIGFKTAWRFK